LDKIQFQVVRPFLAQLVFVSKQILHALQRNSNFPTENQREYYPQKLSEEIMSEVDDYDTPGSSDEENLAEEEGEESIEDGNASKEESSEEIADSGGIPSFSSEEEDDSEFEDAIDDENVVIEEDKLLMWFYKQCTKQRIFS
jgi:hypothetical protein